MESDTLVELLSQSSEASERSIKGQNHRSRVSPEDFFFSNQEAWNKQVFQPDCLHGAMKGVEDGMKSSLDKLIQLTNDYDVTTDNESIATTTGGGGDGGILSGELSENSEILTALNELWVIQSGLREVTSLSEMGELASALTSLETSKNKLASFERDYPGTALHGEILQEIEKLSDQVTRRADNGWHKAIVFEAPLNWQDTKLTVHETVDDLSLENLFEVIQQIDAKKRPTRLEQFLTNLEDKIFTPIFELRITSASRTERELSLKKTKDTSNGKVPVDKLIDVLQVTIEFLQDVFSEPSELINAITKRFSSLIIQELSTKTLPSLFPADSSKLEQFRGQLVKVEEFDQFLQNIEWIKSSELTQWIENFPNEWVLYRKSWYLDKLRQSIMGKELEISRKLDIEFSSERNSTPAAENNDNSKEWEDDWNKEWDDEEEEENVQEGDSMADDWGWGDEDEENDNTSNNKNHNNNKDSKSLDTTKQSSLENTEGAFCSVSTNVDRLKMVVGDFIGEISPNVDSNTLSRQLSDIFALFRALSSLIYPDEDSQVILYNDIMILISSIDNGEIPYISPDDKGLILQLANRTISEVVDEQQSNLTRFLSEAKGFVDCSSEGGNLEACQTAVRQSSQLIENAFTKWSKNGSFPLVCRMIGTLLEGMVTSMMSGIESQEDISEIECGELTNLFTNVSSLQLLFKDPRITSQNGDDDTSAASLAAFYIPSWIKFQYFGEILQSKLVDIVYLFNDNALIDFSTTELVRLIRALFAESEHRQKAINTILSR